MGVCVIFCFICGCGPLYYSRKQPAIDCKEPFMTYNTVKSFTDGYLIWAMSEKPDTNPEPTITFAPIYEFSDKWYLYNKTNGAFADTVQFYTDSNGRINGNNQTTSIQQAGSLTSALIALAEKAVAGGMGALTKNPTIQATPPDCILQFKPKVRNIIGFTQPIQCPKSNSYCIGEIPVLINYSTSGKSVTQCKSKITWQIQKMSNYTSLGKDCSDNKDKSCLEGFRVYDPSPAMIKLMNPFDNSLNFRSCLFRHNIMILNSFTRL
jgi:hypothetical protein